MLRGTIFRCIVAQTRSREAPIPLSACAHTRTRTRMQPNSGASLIRPPEASAAKAGPYRTTTAAGLRFLPNTDSVELLETQISKCADFPLEVGQTGLPVMEARHRIALRRPRRLCARKSTRWLLGFPTVEKIRRRPARAYW